MKYYGIKKERRHDEISYWKARAISFVKPYLIFNSQKRKQAKEWYSRLFGEYDDTTLHRENKIPEGNYHQPVSIIVTELIAKEDIERLKLGIHKLMLEYTSHKFVGVMLSVDDINNGIDDINENLSSFDHWFQCGRFDFERKKELKNLIDYYDIKIRNFSTSYFALEIHIYFADKRRNQLVKLINEDYRGDKGIVSTYYSHNSEKSGAIKNKTLIRFNNDFQKNDLINNLIIETKWYLFDFLSVYLPVVFHNKGLIPPSFNLYKTNIGFEHNESEAFNYSVGKSNYYGDLSPSIRIYFTPETSRQKNQPKRHDMNIIVYEISHEKYDEYYSFDFGLTDEMSHKYGAIYKLFLLNTFNYYFTFVGSQYRNKVNKIKMKKRSYKKLLKIRYEFEKEYALLKRVYHEINWKSEEEYVTDLFLNPDKSAGNSDFFNKVNLFTDYPINKMSIVRDTHLNIEKEIEQKLTILGYLKDYSIENKNYKLNISMLIISTLTLLFVLYPGWTGWITAKINAIVGFVK